MNLLLTLMLSVVLMDDGMVRIEGDGKIDMARPAAIKVYPRGIDLRDRFRGFSLVDDYDDEQMNCTCWLLTPEIAAEAYGIAPFAFGDAVHGPVYFAGPDEREPVTGAIEVEVRRDLPPLSWKLVGYIALWLVVISAAAFGVFMLVRYAFRRVKEHRMSPIERAWVELDRLMKKGLPGRGRYKDFYVELTMVVRRYVQRRYGIRAPHMTTEEFLKAARPNDDLRAFLESADMVKFAGVAATPEMADDATECARTYLKADAAVERPEVKP